MTDIHNPTTEPHYISLMELYHMGITPGMAWHLLGKPQRSSTTKPFPKLPYRQFYRTSHVAARTQGRTFQLLRLANLLHQITKGEAHLKPMTLWAQTVPIRTSFPDLRWDDITHIACLDRWSRQGFHINPTQNSEGMRTLWAYTYLKHNHTNYEELCAQLYGRQFSRYVYPIVLHRINKAILDRFPPCLPKVKGLRTKSSTFRCPTCHTTDTGTFNGYYWEKPPTWLYQLSSSGNYIRTLCSRECSRRRKSIPRTFRRRATQTDDRKTGHRETDRPKTDDREADHQALHNPSPPNREPRPDQGPNYSTSFSTTGLFTDRTASVESP